MTVFTRRNLLTGAGAIALLGGAYVVFDPFRNIPKDIAAILTRHFGKDVAASEPAAEFTADAAALISTLPGRPMPAARLETEVLTAFLQSSTILLHLQRGDALYYLGIFNPYTTPCQSQLCIEV